MAKREKKVQVYDDFETELESKYSGYVRTKEQEESDKIEVISTGSLSLDVSLGVGGIPKRRFSQIYGAESTGKTTLALSISKNAILTDNPVLYVDAEQAVDFEYAEKIIGEEVWDQNKFLLIQPKTLEDSLQICQDGINQKRFGLIILDSVAAMTPRKVIEESLSDKNPFILASMMKVFCQKNQFTLRTSDIAFLGLNQIRDDTSNPYLHMVYAPGGHYWKHILSIDVQLSRASWIKTADETIGLSTKFTIRKNKVAPPFRTWAFPIMFGQGIDYHRDVVEFAEHIGALIKRNIFYTFEGEVIGRGIADTTEKLKENPELLDKIVKLCYNIIDNNYTEVDNKETEEVEDEQIDQG